MNLLPKTIVQILAFRDQNNWSLCATFLWSAMQEIERFYNWDQPRMQCTRFVLDPAFGGKLEEYQSPPTSFTVDPSQSDEPFWASLQGKFRRTIHQGHLSQTIRALLPQQYRESFCMIITDQEIEPPSNWRYIIWDTIFNTAVISVAPTDPLYWRERSSNREAMIKHRVRTAGMNVSGMALGLTRCDNQNCFLFNDVSSALVLDTMLVLGEEHGWQVLSGWGYAPRPKNPEMPQSIQKVAPPEQEERVPGSEMDAEWNTYE